MKSLTDTSTLKNGVEIPCIGLGTWQIPDGELAYNAVRGALSIGYRHVATGGRRLLQPTRSTEVSNTSNGYYFPTSSRSRAISSHASSIVYRPRPSAAKPRIPRINSFVYPRVLVRETPERPAVLGMKDLRLVEHGC